MDKEQAMLAEYQTLREEIFLRQDARHKILGFTVAGTGAVLGVTLRLPPNGGVNYMALALIGFGLVSVAAAVLLTIHHTQQTNLISSYIRKFLEPHMEGLNWETRWTHYRGEISGKSRLGGSPTLGMAKPLATYYAVLIAGLYAALFAVRLDDHLLSFALLTLLGLLGLASCVRLYRTKARAWSLAWEEVAMIHRASGAVSMDETPEFDVHKT